METEKQIIYGIINTLRDAEFNNDERITERLMRTYLNTYRVDSLTKEFKNGYRASDEVFQTLELTLEQSGNEFFTEIPKIIRFADLNGLYLEKMGIPIPLLDSENYFLSKKGYFSQHQPKAKTEQNKLTIYTGIYDSCCVSLNSDTYIVIKAFKDEAALNQTINVNLKCILYNPSQDPSYDWETSIYPFPSERIRELKDQVLYKEFGVMSKAKRDEIQNARNDEIRYHDNDDVGVNG